MNGRTLGLGVLSMVLLDARTAGAQLGRHAYGILVFALHEP
jgi:hypothetical protein